MNIILFHRDEVDRPLPRSDRRSEHLLNVLNRQLGDETDVGLINGRRGKATLVSVGRQELELQFRWRQEPEPLAPIDLIVGLSRPQTCRKILREATSLGVRRIWFATTDRGESSYATSKLWTTDQWKRLLIEGAAQAFTTRIPTVEFGMSLAGAIGACGDVAAPICLDNYEAPASIKQVLAVQPTNACVIAVGAERGWTGDERALFRSAGFQLATLGHRPLRTETAVIAAVSIVLGEIETQGRSEV